MSETQLRPRIARSETRPLDGQRVLYVGVGFYSYDTIIANGLRDLGADVEVVTERPHLLLRSHFSSPINYIPPLRELVQRRHERHLKEQLSAHKFDSILVVKGDSLDVGFFDFLRRTNPSAKFVLYQWDSIARVRGFAELRKRFDRCLTFDRFDAEADNTLLFRPLFFSQPIEEPCKTVQGLVFVGTVHSKRLRAIRKIRAMAKAMNVPTKIHLRVGLLNFIKNALAFRLQEISYTPLPYETYVKWTEEAEAVVDLPHPKQSGLTMRTAEAIGLGKKIITTNKDIRNYEFYDPNLILVVNAENPEVPEGFLNGSPAVYPSETIVWFSLRTWLYEVLDLQEAGTSEARRMKKTPV